MPILCATCSSCYSVPLARTCMNEQIARVLKQLHLFIELGDYDLALELFNGTMLHRPNECSTIITDLKENATKPDNYKEFHKKLLLSVTNPYRKETIIRARPSD
eukprot:3936562-Rhodomonas_salina.1